MRIRLARRWTHDVIYLDIFNLSFKFNFYLVHAWQWRFRLFQQSLKLFYWQLPTMSIMWVIKYED